MKNKKLSFRSWRVVALCLMCLFGVTQMWAADPIENVGTYSTQVISADGLTSTWTFIQPGSQVTVPTAGATDNEVMYAPSGSSKQKFSSSNAFSWSGTSSCYFPVPSGSAGTISITMKSSSDTRWIQLYVSGSAAADSKRLWSKYNATPTSDGKKGPQSFSFTADDITTVGTKTYLHFKDNNTEMKIASISITLTTGNYRNDLTAHTVTYKANGGTGADVTDNDAKKIASCSFIYTGKDFNGWNTATDGTGDAYAVDDNVTKDLVLYAQWVDHVAKYTVKYMDGTTVLGTEEVNVTSTPAGLAENPKKDCYTFAGWDPALNTVSGDENDVVEVSATWTPVYSSSATLISDANVSAKANVNTIFAASNIVSSITFTSGNYEFTSNETKKGYYGYKDKASGDYMKILVQQGKRVQVLFGNLGADPTIKINGANGALDAARLTGDNAENTFTYNASSADALISITMGSGTNTLKSVTIENIPVLSDDATLSDLKVNGTTVAGFASGTQIYRTSVAYGTAVADMPKITSATATDENATVSDVQETFYDSDHGYYVSQVKVTAQNGTDYKFYQLRITVEPKLGVELIKALTSTTLSEGVGTATGYIGGKYYTNNGSGSTKKLDKNKNYGLELKGDNTFDEGDLFVMNITAAAGGNMGTMKVYESAEAADNLYESTNIGTTGLNAWVLPSAVDTKNAVFVKRGGGDDWNPTFSYIAVYRYMAPFIESFEIEGIGALTINGTNITAEVANDFNVTALTPTIKYWANGEAQIDKTGAQDFTNPVTYTVSSQYAEDATGDYAPVTYTVTITKVVPSATPNITTQPQGTNYYEGATIAALSVVAEAEDNGTLTYQWYLGADAIDGATEATYQPTVSEIGSYSYTCVVTNKKDDKPAASVTSNAAVIAIEDDPAAIKLIEAGAINHTNFITGATMSESPVSIATVDYDYAKLGSTASNPSVNALNKLIAYNATTTKTKVMIDVYNKNTSARTVKIWGVVEGSSEYEELASIALDNGDNKRVKSAYYEFNNLDGKNRTIYIGVPSSVSDVAFLQVKVVESGDPIHMFGEVGYSINFNKGRLFGPSANDLAFEGMTYKLSSGYQALSSTAISLNKTSSYALTVANPVTMNVTTTNGAKFYVDQTTDGTANETASTGAHEFDLTAGTWYINVAGSNLSVSSISFALPKAAKPVVADMDDVEYCQGSAIDALTVSATVSDGGTMLYQWYKDGEIIAGAEAATYQPTEPAADGEYYVVVVNTKAGYQNNPTQSNTITVTGHAGTAISGTTGAEDWPDAHVTISVTASGKNLSYAWYTCDDAMGTNPVAVEPAVNAAELDVTVGAADTYYKVVVSGDCGSAQEAVITVVARQTVELQDVTGDMSWDFSKANDGSAAGSDLCTDEVLANVHGINNNDDFKSAYLKATANKFKSGKLQASMIKFHTTVDGMITVVFSNTGSKSSDRYLTVNGRKTDKGSKNETAVTYTGFVYAGDVVLGVVEGDGNMLNFTSVQFTATTSYTRPVNPSFLGTLCWTNDAILGGGTLYEFAGKDEHNYLAFDEVEENRLEAGKPYIFMPENGNTEIKVYNTDDAEPLTTNQAHVNHMYGTIVDTDLYPTTDVNMYYFSSNHIWAVKDFTVEKITIPAYYCYVDYPAVLAGEPAAAPAQGRRRVTMGVNGQNTTTGIGEIEASETPMKVMINGQIFIIRGEKMYDVTGKLVK